MKHWIAGCVCLLLLGSCTSHDANSRAFLAEYQTWNTALVGLEDHFERLDLVLSQEKPPLHDTAFAALSPADSAFHTQRKRLFTEVSELRNEALQELKVYRIDVAQLEGRFRDLAQPDGGKGSQKALEKRLNQLHEQSRATTLLFEGELKRLKQKSQSRNQQAMNG